MSAMTEGMKACPFCQRDESELEGNMWDRDRGAAAVAAIPPEEIVRASDMLREYNGKTNSWGARAALISAVGMLRGRYQKVRCDSDGVSGCVRCMTMFLVRSMECLLAASARTAAPSSSPDVAALRKLVPFLEAHHVDASAVVNAADALEQMQRRVEAMREALVEARAFVVIQGPGEAFPDVMSKIDAALGDGAV